jgi:hypothetical protein
MTDDQGYGVSGTFGGVIPTPSMDRIAARKEANAMRSIQSPENFICIFCSLARFCIADAAKPFHSLKTSAVGLARTLEDERNPYPPWPPSHSIHDRKKPIPTKPGKEVLPWISPVAT